MLCACCAAKGADTDAKQEPGGGRGTRDSQAEEVVRAGGGRRPKGAKSSSSLWVTFRAVDFKKQTCSPELEDMLGPFTDSACMLDVLGGNALRRAVQENINELCYSDDAPRSMTMNSAFVTSVKGNKTWKATIELDFELDPPPRNSGSDDIELDAILVEARLLEVRDATPEEAAEAAAAAAASSSARPSSNKKKKSGR
mmetsp:Transcript_94394/g.185103  ORF Transcript_94394/g.185103 Transcript_94394/m.185103 type:complete len:198 (+) Transcript_94394:159-752(+)